MEKQDTLLFMSRALLATAMVLLTTLTISADVTIDSTNFPDANFMAYVKTLDGGDDGKFTDNELSGITSIDCNNKQIANLKGVEYFTALSSLNCSDNNLMILDLKANTKLGNLNCRNNKLNDIDISNCVSLFYFICSHNNLKKLDVSNNVGLMYLDCVDNHLTSLDLSKNTSLVIANLSGQTREVQVNYEFEQDGQTYSYLNMVTDEREGMSGDELHNKVGNDFVIGNATWNNSDAKVGKTPYGKTDALIWTGRPATLEYDYDTKNPSLSQESSKLQVKLILSYEGVTTAVEDIDADKAVRIYAAGGVICIEGSEEAAQVYDMAGRRVYAGTEREISVPNGMYVVKVGSVTKKVVI